MTRARLMQFAFLWLVVSAMVWLTTIWRWQGQGVDVGVADMLLYLLVLPLLLASVLGGALWVGGRAKRMAADAARPPMATRAATAAEGAAAPSPWADARWAHAAVLAEAVNLSLGQDAAGVAAALQQGQTRPGLDAELHDVDGLPVFTSRHEDLDVEGWLARAPATTPWSAEVARSLALLEPVLAQMGESLWLHAGAEAPGWQAWLKRRGGASAAGMAPSAREADGPSYLAGVARPVSPATELARKAQAPTLHVRLALPAWPAAQRAQAVEWVKSQCGALLDWAEAVQARGIVWQTEALAQNEDLWTEVDQTLTRWQQDGRPELLLVLAADSALSPEVIDHMQARGELFTAQHQSGRMPGEAAAACLLGTAHWLGQATLEMGAGLPDEVQAPVRLWRPVRVRRDRSADAHGRVGAQALTAALARCRDQHALQADTLHVFSDADHRASRTAELYESLTEAAPGTDPLLAISRVGQACGDLGVAGALVPMALASARARDTQVDAGAPAQAPMCLAALVQSTHERVVLPLAPWGRLASPNDAVVADAAAVN